MPSWKRAQTAWPIILPVKVFKAGDHIGLYMYNCGEYLEAMLACFKIRAVPINVNYRYVKDELLYIFDNADMVACIHHREFAPHIAEVRDAAKKLKTFRIGRGWQRC